jgi:peptidoglycan/LPS O-acetylase OafA/YrhL
MRLSLDRRVFLNVQVLRGVSAIMVLLHHLSLRELQDWPEAHFHLFYPFYFFGASELDLFFVISGFVITTSSINDLGDPSRIWIFLKRRFYRIYPIYWLTCLPVLAWSALHHGRDWFGSLAALMLTPGYSNQINPVSWSLIVEVMCYAMFAVFMWFSPRLLPVFMSIWAIGITAHFFDPTFFLPNWNWTPVLFRLVNFGFIFGVAIALFARVGKFKFVRTVLFYAIAMSLIGLFLSAVGFYPLVHSNPGRLLFLELTAACVVYGAVGLELAGQVWTSATLRTLGEASYSIYLVHYLVILASKPFYASIHGIFYQICWTLGLLAIALFLGMATYLFVEKPLLQLFKEKMRSKSRSLSNDFEAALLEPSLVAVGRESSRVS